MPDIHLRKAIWLQLLFTMLFTLGAASTAQASDTQSQLTMIVNEQGLIDVVDRWSGLAQETGVFNYFSATRELGVIPVTVKHHGFTIAFKTRSYLRYEDGLYYFVTPDFYYAEGRLDVELSLTVPANLQFLGAEPEPSYIGDSVFHWSLVDCSHQVVIARFERTGPFAPLGATGPGFQVDPAILTKLSAEELPKSADEVLKELETIITLAKAASATDPDLLKVMDKLLAKFYYILSVSGLLQDYRLPKNRAPAAVNPALKPHEVIVGLLESPAEAAANR